MKSTLLMMSFLLCSSVPMSCSKKAEAARDTAPLQTEEVLIARGKYLTTIGGCNDCHSPKVLTPEGMDIDTTRLFSGHPQEEVLGSVIVTDDWLVMNNGFTAFVGPWGISYAANLSPDDTGIGNWKFEQFVTAIRKGKYKGIESNRSLLPPMPWQMYRTMTDEDLLAVFTYLQSVPPQNNLVPQPVSRDKIKNLNTIN